jgi:hypothetical protein
MKDAAYNLQFVGNVLLAVMYIFGGLAFLFPNESPIVQPFGPVALGIVLLATGIFGSPYSTYLKKHEEPPCEPKRGCEGE